MRILVPILSRLLSTLFALALIAGGVLLIVEAVSTWVGAGWSVLPDDVVRRASAWQWSDRTVVMALAIVGALGLSALLTAVWRRPALTVPVDGRSGAAVERYALEKSLRSRLEAVDGVSGARVRVNRKRVAARVDTKRRHEPGQLKTVVEQELDRTLNERHLNLNLRRRLRLRYEGGEV